jgi:hypothetical protein
MSILDGLENPVISRSDNLRDPAVTQVGDEWHIYFSRVSNSDWNALENWAVARLRTKDWRSFYDDRDLTPKGYGSPGDIVWWHGRWILPYQSYPVQPSALYFSESGDRVSWSEPRPFLSEALSVRWNSYGRAIDPTIVVHDEQAYCFFTGSLNVDGRRANVVGLAVTEDPDLQEWEILSKDAPLIQPSERYPDGAENLTIYPAEAEAASPEDAMKDDAVIDDAMIHEADPDAGANRRWIMIYSAGLKKQRLAGMWSADLRNWHDPAPIELEPQWWCERRIGAPCTFTVEGELAMLVMGTEEVAGRRTRLGIARRSAAGQWYLPPAGPREQRQASDDLSF